MNKRTEEEIVTTITTEITPPKRKAVETTKQTTPAAQDRFFAYKATEIITTSTGFLSYFEKLAKLETEFRALFPHDKATSALLDGWFADVKSIAGLMHATQSMLPEELKPIVDRVGKAIKTSDAEEKISLATINETEKALFIKNILPILEKVADWLEKDGLALPVRFRHGYDKLSADKKADIQKFGDERATIFNGLYIWDLAIQPLQFITKYPSLIAQLQEFKSSFPDHDQKRFDEISTRLPRLAAKANAMQAIKDAEQAINTEIKKIKFKATLNQKITAAISALEDYRTSDFTEKKAAFLNEKIAGCLIDLLALADTKTDFDKKDNPLNTLIKNLLDVLERTKELHSHTPGASIFNTGSFKKLMQKTTIMQFGAEPITNESNKNNKSGLQKALKSLSNLSDINISNNLPQTVKEFVTTPEMDNLAGVSLQEFFAAAFPEQPKIASSIAADKQYETTLKQKATRENILAVLALSESVDKFKPLADKNFNPALHKSIENAVPVLKELKPAAWQILHLNILANRIMAGGPSAYENLQAFLQEQFGLGAKKSDLERHIKKDNAVHQSRSFTLPGISKTKPIPKSEIDITTSADNIVMIHAAYTVFKENWKPLESLLNELLAVEKNGLNTRLFLGSLMATDLTHADPSQLELIFNNKFNALPKELKNDKRFAQIKRLLITITGNEAILYQAFAGNTAMAKQALPLLNEKSNFLDNFAKRKAEQDWNTIKIKMGGLLPTIATNLPDYTSMRIIQALLAVCSESAVTNIDSILKKLDDTLAAQIAFHAPSKPLADKLKEFTEILKKAMVDEYLLSKHELNNDSTLNKESGRHYASLLSAAQQITNPVAFSVICQHLISHAKNIDIKFLIDAIGKINAATSGSAYDDKDLMETLKHLGFIVTEQKNTQKSTQPQPSNLLLNEQRKLRAVASLLPENKSAEHASQINFLLAEKHRQELIKGVTLQRLVEIIEDGHFNIGNSFTYGQLSQLLTEGNIIFPKATPYHEKTQAALSVQSFIKDVNNHLDLSNRKLALEELRELASLNPTLEIKGVPAPAQEAYKQNPQINIKNVAAILEINAFLENREVLIRKIDPDKFQARFNNITGLNNKNGLNLAECNKIRENALNAISNNLKADLAATTGDKKLNARIMQDKIDTLKMHFKKLNNIFKPKILGGNSEFHNNLKANVALINQVIRTNEALTRTIKEIARVDKNHLADILTGYDPRERSARDIAHTWKTDSRNLAASQVKLIENCLAGFKTAAAVLTKEINQLMSKAEELESRTRKPQSQKELNAVRNKKMNLGALLSAAYERLGTLRATVHTLANADNPDLQKLAGEMRSALVRAEKAAGIEVTYVEQERKEIFKIEGIIHRFSNSQPKNNLESSGAIVLDGNKTLPPELAEAETSLRRPTPGTM